MAAIRNTTAILLLAILAIPACRSSQRTDSPAVLLYNGEGTSKNDVRAIEKLIEECGFNCVSVGSVQLDGMSDRELSGYRLIVFPGGNYIEMGNGLTTDTTQRIRRAVSIGTNYLGVCAGGLLAGNANCNNFNLTNGVKFKFYEAVNRNVHKAVVSVVDANAHSIEHYWEDGPRFQAGEMWWLSTRMKALR